MDRFPAVYFSTILHNFSAHSLRARRRSGYAPRLTTPSEEKVSSLSSGRNYQMQREACKKKIF